jgi:hypothetical protein
MTARSDYLKAKRKKSERRSTIVLSPSFFLQEQSLGYGQEDNSRAL